MYMNRDYWSDTLSCLYVVMDMWFMDDPIPTGRIALVATLGVLVVFPLGILTDESMSSRSTGWTLCGRVLIDCSSVVGGLFDRIFV